MNFKRKIREYEDIQIDIPYLLNQQKALSEKEFKLCLPKADYSAYMSKFFKRRVEDLFEEYKSESWFIDRYLSESRVKDDYNGPINNVLVYRNINNWSTLRCVLEKNTDVVYFSTSQNDIKQRFSVDLYIIIEDKNEKEQVVNSLDSIVGSKAEKIDLSEIKLKDRVVCDNRYMKRMLPELCNLNDCDEKAVQDAVVGEGSGDFTCISNADYLNILRTKFNFCVFCCKQYDNRIAMLDNCSKHSSFKERSLSLLSYPKGVESLFFKNTDLTKFYSKTLEMNYKCNKCSKIFESIEKITLHMTKKHEELGVFVGNKDEKMGLFLKKMDVFFINHCLGTYENTIPSFYKSPITENSVVYDMPAVFSGKFEF